MSMESAHAVMLRSKVQRESPANSEDALPPDQGRGLLKRHAHGPEEHVCGRVEGRGSADHERAPRLYKFGDWRCRLGPATCMHASFILHLRTVVTKSVVIWFETGLQAKPILLLLAHLRLSPGQQSCRGGRNTTPCKTSASP